MFEIIIALLCCGIAWFLWNAFEISVDHRRDRTTILIWREQSGPPAPWRRPAVPGGWGPPPPRPPQQPAPGPGWPSGSGSPEEENRTAPERRMDQMDQLMERASSPSRWLSQSDTEGGGRQDFQRSKAPPPDYKAPPRGPGNWRPPVTDPVPPANPCVPPPRQQVPMPVAIATPASEGPPTTLTPEQGAGQSTEVIAALRDNRIPSPPSGPPAASHPPTPAPPPSETSPPGYQWY